MTRQTLVFEAVAGTLARLAIQGVRRDPVVDDLRVGIGLGDEGLQAADRLRPFERIDVILDAEHGRRVDGLALEDALDELAALGHAEDLRQRPGRLVALEPLHRAGREDQHAVRRFAAQHLLPGEGDHIELRKIEFLREGRRGRVADRRAPRGRRRSSRRSARARRRWCRSR